MDVLADLHGSCGSARIVLSIWIQYNMYECAGEGILSKLSYSLIFELEKSIFGTKTNCDRSHIIPLVISMPERIAWHFQTKVLIKEAFRENSVRISNCWAFSLLKIVPAAGQFFLVTVDL